MKFEDFHANDGLALAQLVKDKQVTPAELLEVSRQRLSQVNGKINAVVVEMNEQADKRAGEDLSGPFAGVPFLLKDLGQDYAGLPTSWGSRALVNTPAEEHSTVVNRWLAAGTVIFGKTNTPEFGAKGITEPELFGPCRNPYDLSRTTGGSSGGSAAAVAAGILPVAGASDGGGSIRIPAGCCGLVGLKPSRGLIPHGPQAGEPIQGSVTNGVLSWSVRDSAAMLDVLKGPDATSPSDVAVPAESFLDQISRDPGKLKIGFCTVSAINPNPDSEAIRAVEGAAKLLESLGHHVEEVAPPCDDHAVAKDFLTTWFASLAAGIDEVKERVSNFDINDFELDTQIMAAMGNVSSGKSVVAAIDGRHNHVKALAEFHSKFDLLLTPTLATEPPKVGSLELPAAQKLAAKAALKVGVAGHLSKVGKFVDQSISDNLGWVPYTQLANITGRPAISVPLHWTANNLPLGVQFVGKLGADGLLLQLARQLEQAQPWAARRPLNI